jgi:hypothetical protein
MTRIGEFEPVGIHTEWPFLSKAVPPAGDVGGGHRSSTPHSKLARLEKG